MKSKYLRPVSLLLAVCMVFSLCVIPAFAATSDIVGRPFTYYPPQGSTSTVNSLLSYYFQTPRADIVSTNITALNFNFLLPVDKSSSFISTLVSLIEAYFSKSLSAVDFSSSFDLMTSDNLYFIESGYQLRFDLDVYMGGRYEWGTSPDSYSRFLGNGVSYGAQFLCFDSSDRVVSAVDVSNAMTTSTVSLSSSDFNCSEGSNLTKLSLHGNFRVPETGCVSYVVLQIYFNKPVNPGCFTGDFYSAMGRSPSVYISGTNYVDPGYVNNEVSAVYSYINSQLSVLRAELQSHEEDVAASLSDIVDYLVEIKANEALIKSYVSLIFQELDGFGADVDKALAYLNSISQNTATMVTALNTVQSYLSEGNTTLTKILSSCLSMSSDLASALDYMNRLCSDVGALREQGESVQTYLESIDSRFDFLNEKIKSFEEKIGDQSKSLRDILTYLASIDTSLSSASSYLQNISTNVAGLKDDTSAIIQLITTSNTTIKNIYSTLGSILSKLGSGQQNFIQLILNNLISQGTKLDRILSLLQTIETASSTTAANSTLIVSSLETLLSDLEKLEAAHTDTNERLDKIADLIEGFEVNIQKSVDKVYTSSDKKGLGGILASIVSRLSSIINFVGDVFGNMLTSIPDMIGGFNDSLAFWDTAERYEYRPYQIGIYAKDSADYTNSNSAVQALFAEAEKYLGYPYVWGGASPETSFDCSGYVSYVLNASGVYPVSRLTAQGLYNICTPVDASEAMPGDLIFFTKTYQTTDTVTHVGFYAGDGRMLHCGDPIQYIDWENSHYKSHFYAFGRLPYNSTPHFEKDLPEYLFFDLEALENDGFVTLDLSVTFSEPDYLIHWYCSEDAGSTWNQIADYDGLSTVPVSVQYPFADFLECVNDNPIWIKCVAESNAGQTYDSTAARIIYDGWEGHYAE